MALYFEKVPKDIITHLTNYVCRKCSNKIKLKFYYRTDKNSEKKIITDPSNLEKLIGWPSLFLKCSVSDDDSTFRILFDISPSDIFELLDFESDIGKCDCKHDTYYTAFKYNAAKDRLTIEKKRGKNKVSINYSKNKELIDLIISTSLLYCRKADSKDLFSG